MDISLEDIKIEQDDYKRKLLFYIGLIRRQPLAERKVIKIDIDNIQSLHFKVRLEMGFPLKFKKSRLRDTEKLKSLIDFYLNTTPSARDILSGKAFRALLKR